MIRRAVVLIPGLLAFGLLAFGQAPVTITTPAQLPDGYQGLSYGPPPQFQGLQFTAQTNPSPTTITWTVLPGTPLPQGLTLTSGGFLSGAPASTGDYTFTIRAITQYGADSRTFALHVATPTVTITSASPLPDGFYGQAYNDQLSATGNPALGITWGIDGNLPQGLFFTPNGLIYGNPTSVGTYNFVVTASLTGTNVFVSKQFTLTVYQGQVQILTTTLPVAQIGTGYSATLQSNPAGATWVLQGSNLPPGISFNAATGVLSGGASVPGIYKFGVGASYPNYLNANSILTLYATNGPLKIQETSLPVAIQNAPYNVTLTPLGGLSPFQWSLTGANPLGFTIDPNTGTVSGTPTVAPGTSYPLSVVLSDVAGEQFVQPYSVFVAGPLSISTTSLPNGTVNSPYVQAVTAVGGQAPYTWVLPPTSPPLPPGLSFGTDGVIRGTPTQNGVYPIIVQVTDFGRRTATANLSITIGANVTLSIGPGSLPDGQPSVPYSIQLTATGGTAPYTFTVPANSLPQGLSLSPSGLLSGTPVGPPQAPLGTSTFTVTVKDSTATAVPLTGQKTYTLNVTLPLAISTTSLPNGTIGIPYPQSGVQTAVQASGGQPSYSFSIVSGTLPAGLTLNASGILNGTPTGPAGVSTITVQVQDSGGQVIQKQFTITIAAGATPPVISTGNISGVVGTALSTTLQATGGTSPYTFALTGGTLPAGLTFAGGTLSGTPSASGSSTLTFSVTDAQQQTASKTITVAVTLPPPPPATIAPVPATPAQQPNVTLSLGSAYPVPVIGTLSLSFQSAAGGSPSEVQFLTTAGGSQTASVPFAAGSLTGPSVPLVTGTVAGTITITTKLSANGVDVTPTPAPTQTIVIKPSVPVIQSVTFSNTGGVVTVTVIGYSTTREVISGDFTFAVSTGNTVANSGVVTVPLTSAFATWYASSASNPFGGQFKLTIPFNVANGTSAQVTSVSVKLTNTQGTSAAASPQ